MYNIDLLSDRVVSEGLERRWNRELLRQDRIFNAKVRTIGVDQVALDSQVKVRREREDVEKQSVKQCAADLVRNDRTACLLEQRQAKDERQLQDATRGFRQAFQQPWSRREFDLNDSEHLKTQEGVQMLPGLTGEDTDQRARLKRQREQLREWSVQQQNELNTARYQQSLEEHQYDRGRVDMDNRALLLQNMEEERRRAVALTTKDFNLAMAAAGSERRHQERQQEEEDRRAHILNQQQGELLSESLEQSTSTLGLRRLRPDSYKGLTPEQQLSVIQQQQEQVVQGKRLQAEKVLEEAQQAQRRLAAARTAVLQERQQARVARQLRRELDDTNAQLAAARLAKKTHLEDVYSSVPDESYFSQFNTGSR
ncbi:RIB43A-like with coiled-coils protein 2 [Osmerus mordax]|uniref:RIB43A-like with coiled-coils protein 2 n=1 Tax=Osmerus mordax TaxID=8014 RepID=UPI00350FD57C